ncbi:MAG: shikimate kinase AroK [Gammaproteobacteria bacterium]|nr:shikimate kinase AroK [Gammaproteobacteria bacterium]
MTTQPQNIFLVGPMGSGKTAVGRRLAQDIGREFADSDTVIEARTGVDIPFIFEKEGEAGFRGRECEVIDELTQQAGIVLATGGGAILSADNRSCLASRGIVIYLHASVDQQLQRTRRGQGRPLLNSGDPRQVLSELLKIREPLYLEIADLRIDTDNRTVAAVAAEIRDNLVKMEQLPGSHSQ